MDETYRIGIPQYQRRTPPPVGQLESSLTCGSMGGMPVACLKYSHIDAKRCIDILDLGGSIVKTVRVNSKGSITSRINCPGFRKKPSRKQFH